MGGILMEEFKIIVCSFLGFWAFLMLIYFIFPDYFDNYDFHKND